MKLTIERSQFLKSLSHAQSVVERANTIPILGNVMLEATDGRLRLSATDLELGAVETVEAEAISGGGTTLPAQVLYDIARKLPDGAQVELETEDGSDRIRLRCGRSTFTLSALPPEEFPELSKAEFACRFQLAAEDLRGLIDRTGFAASTEETRYYLNGIYLHTTEHEGVPVLRAVATDGHRLARVEVPRPAGAEDMPGGVIVPRKAVQELRKLLEGEDGDVSISLSETGIRFVIGSVELTSKLIDGTYPDYERVIPTGNDKRLEVESGVLAEAVDRVAAISSERTRAVKLAIDADSMQLSAADPTYGMATEEIDVRFDGGAPMEIGFNARYLLEILRRIDGGTAALELADPAAPTLVRDMVDSSALYVLMPMRV